MTRLISMIIKEL